MFRTMRPMAFVILLAGCSQSESVPPTPRTAEPPNAGTAYAQVRDGKLWCNGVATKTYVKERTHTFIRNGKTERVSEYVPHNVKVITPQHEFSLEGVAAFDRSGARIDPSLLPKLLETQAPVFVSYEPKIAPEVLQSLADERLILVLPAKKPQDKQE